MAVTTTNRMTPRGSAIAPIRVVIASAPMRASITFSSPRGPPPKPHVRPTSLYDSGGGAHISQSHPPEPAPLGFREVFARTSYKDRNLFACSQARLVNNLNDGMSWGVFPLFFATFGLGVERIGILKAVYPAVWGTLQVATGPLSDH